MTIQKIKSGRREPIAGSGGWTAADLDDPAFERVWTEERFEMLEGVLTPMPAARFDGSSAIANLLHEIAAYTRRQGTGGQLGVEADIILSPSRVVIADMAYLSPEALKAQAEIHRSRAFESGRYGRLRVPPTLIVESVSEGHEAHDRTLKRQWYAEAGVPHFWLLDTNDRTLECLVLKGSTYHTAALGRDNEIIPVPLFEGLVINLALLWPDSD